MYTKRITKLDLYGIMPSFFWKSFWIAFFWKHEVKTTFTFPTCCKTSRNSATSSLHSLSTLLVRTVCIFTIQWSKFKKLLFFDYDHWPIKLPVIANQHNRAKPLAYLGVQCFDYQTLNWLVSCFDQRSEVVYRILLNIIFIEIKK